MNVLAINLEPTTVSLLRSKNFSVFTNEALPTLHNLEIWLERGIYDACVIVINKGDLSLTVARSLRSKGIDTPLIGIMDIPNEKSRSEYRAAFLEHGGDYLLCESNTRELAASLHAIARRLSLRNEEKIEYRFGSAHLVVDKFSHQVTLNEVSVILTNRELEILQLFIKTPGRIFSREAIISHMFSDRLPESNVVASLISRVRIKLRAIHPDADKFIKPLPGKGYLFQSQSNIH